MPPEPRFFIRATLLDPGLRCDVTDSSPENISRKNCTYLVNYFPRPIDTKGRKAGAAPAFFSSLTMDQASHVYSLVQRIDMGKRVTRAWGFATTTISGKAGGATRKSHTTGLSFLCKPTNRRRLWNSKASHAVRRECRADGWGRLLSQTIGDYGTESHGSAPDTGRQPVA